MLIQGFPSGPFLTNAYLVSCTKTRSTAIIDPSPQSAVAILKSIKDQELIPEKILLTHSHWDHIADISLIRQVYPKIPVSIHPLDKENLFSPGSDRIPCLVPIAALQEATFFQDDEIFTIGNFTWQVIHTPGHSPGSVCFYCESNHILFSGDTLFKGSIGNLSLPTANPDLMWKSLDKLALLPKETHIYPGHGQDTYLKNEVWIKEAKKWFGYC